MDDETLRVGAWWFALVIASLVGILSWMTGVSFLWIKIRIIFSYLLIYGLSYGSLYVFKKNSIFHSEDNLDSSRDRNVNNLSGTLLDVAVGQEDEQWDMPPAAEQEMNISPAQRVSLRAGQVNADLSQGMPDTEKQADMVRRMGWGD